MRSALGQIRAVTYAVPDLSVIEETYPRWLRYRIVARGEVPASVAESWDAPALSGAPFITLAPESGEPTYFRFVRDPLASGWRALVTHGWNVSEIVVSDVDALAASLADSPFRIIGPPATFRPSDADPISHATTHAAAAPTYHEGKRRALTAFEREYFSRLLSECNGSVVEISRRAELQRAHVRKYLREHGLAPTRARGTKKPR